MNLLEIPTKNSKEYKKILESMHKYSYNYICAKENLSTAPLAYYHYNVGLKSNHIYNPKEPNRNGKYITLPVPRTLKYMKFSLALNIYTNEDNKDRRANKLNLKIQSLAERSALNRTSFEVYVDNLKVPDTEVYVTIMNGTTDVYVPASYYEINGSYMDLIVRKYNKDEPYMNYVLTGYNDISDRVTIDITGATIQNGNGQENTTKISEVNYQIREEDLRIYRNGKFLQPSYYELKFLENNRLTLIMKNNEAIYPSDIFEFHIEPHTSYISHSMSISSPIIKFPRDVLPGLPIAPGLCDMYIDGQRLFDRDIEVVSPRIYRIKDTIYRDDVRLSVLMNANLDKIKPFDYMEDTSRYFMTLGEDYIEDIILDDIYPDTGLEWLKTSSFPEKIEYNNAKGLITKPSIDEYTDDIIKKYIDQNGHNIIPLVGEFSEDTIEEYTFDQTYVADSIRLNTNKELGSVTYRDDVFVSNLDTSESSYETEFGTFKSASFGEEMVVFKTRRFFDTPDEDLMIFINGIKINKVDIPIIKFKNNCWFYVPKRMIPTANNFRVTIKHVPIYNSAECLVLLEMDEVKVYDNVYYLDPNQFGSIQELSDIYVYKIGNIGCKLLDPVSDYRLTFNKELGLNGTIELRFNESFKKSISDRYYITNISYYNYSQFTGNDENNMALVLDQYDIAYNCYRPKASHYNYMIFRNGILLVENVDYYITGPITSKMLYQTRIVFKNRGEDGDFIEVYTIEEPRMKFGTCKLLDLPYNVIYLKNSILGFHNSYSELIINDMIVPKENIKMIGLNMLLVKDVDYIKHPFTKIYTRSTLVRPIVSVMEYITYYNDHQSDWKLYLDRLVKEGRLDDILDIVEKFVTDEEKHDSYGDDEDKYIDPFLDKVARDLRDGRIARYINCNKPVTFINTEEYLQVMSEEHALMKTISLDCNLFNSISILLSIDPQIHLRSVEDITEIVSKAIKERQFPFLKNGILDANIEITDEEYYDALKYPISRKLYLEEIHLAEPDFDKYITETRPIDANIGADYDFELEEKVLEIPFNKFKYAIKRKYNALTGEWEINKDDNGKPIMEFVYTIDLSSYNIENLKALKINSVYRKPEGNMHVKGVSNGDYRYYSKDELLEISTSIYSTDTIEIIYETKKYNTN